MAFLKGIDIILHEKVCTGKDAFNREIFEEVPVTVSNVLVAPVESAGTQEVLSEVSLNGKGARYQLGIPKGDTHNWEDVTVEFFGHTWRTVGFSVIGIDELIPLDWNRKVTVERYG